MGKKKNKLPSIVNEIKLTPKKEIDWGNEKLISYSQFSMFTECPKKWSLQYKEGFKTFNSTIHTVFGSSIHLALQHCINVMYNESFSAASKLDLIPMFEEAIQDEYKKQYKLNNKKHFSNADELRSMFNDGVEIIKYFQNNKTKYFPNKGWCLVGCEIPITFYPNSKYPKIIYQGYLDVVLYNSETNTIKIIDLKTSTSGWRDKEKNDKIKQYQLVLYKSFFSRYYNFPKENIEIEFLILKRKIPKESDFPIKRIQVFIPPSGVTSINKSTELFNKFISEAFDYNGFKEIEHQPTINKNCQYCQFHKTVKCPATFES